MYSDFTCGKGTRKKETGWTKILRHGRKEITTLEMKQVLSWFNVLKVWCVDISML